MDSLAIRPLAAINNRLPKTTFLCSGTRPMVRSIMPVIGIPLCANLYSDSLCLTCGNASLVSVGLWTSASAEKRGEQSIWKNKFGRMCVVCSFHWRLPKRNPQKFERCPSTVVPCRGRCCGAIGVWHVAFASSSQKSAELQCQTVVPNGGGRKTISLHFKSIVSF